MSRIVQVLREPGSVSLAHGGAVVVRDAILIGLLAIGERLKSGAELERGDEVAVLAHALIAMDYDDDGEPVK